MGSIPGPAVGMFDPGFQFDFGWKTERTGGVENLALCSRRFEFDKNVNTCSVKLASIVRALRITKKCDSEVLQ